MIAKRLQSIVGPYNKNHNKCVKYSGVKPGSTIHDKKHREKCYKSEDDCWKHNHKTPPPYTGKCCAVVNMATGDVAGEDVARGRSGGCTAVPTDDSFIGFKTCSSDNICATNYNVLPGFTPLYVNTFIMHF